MSFLEATNTLLDVDTWHVSSTFFSSEFSQISPDRPDATPPNWNSSSDDRSGLTSLTDNTSSNHYCQSPQGENSSELLSSVEVSTWLSLPSGCEDSENGVQDLDLENAESSSDFADHVQASCLTSEQDLETTEYLREDAEDCSSRSETEVCASSKTESVPQKRTKSGAKKTKYKNQRATNINNTLPPCRICADAASGFHYGVNSCEACKRFFRRALRRKRHFKCKDKKNCVIKGKKNNVCGYCRYSRCLALGMSRTAIKTGRYTHHKRALDSKEVQQLHTNPTSLRIPEAEVTEVVRKLVQVHARILTNAHVSREVMLRRAVETLEEFQLKREVFGFQDTLTPEQYDEVFRVTGLDVDERQQDMKFVAKSIDVFVYGYVKFGKGVPGFSQLSLDDQSKLLKLARVEVWFLGAYQGLMKDCGIFYAPNHFVKHKFDMEKILGKEYMDYAFEMASRMQGLNLLFDEVVVLKAVCLTFTDRCEMEDAAKVDEIQWSMLKCLLHLLHKNHPEEPGLFHKVMNALVALRNLSELSRKALANGHFADAIRNNATLFELVLL